MLSKMIYENQKFSVVIQPEWCATPTLPYEDKHRCHLSATEPICLNPLAATIFLDF